MVKTICRMPSILATVCLLATPATAAIYTVTLEGGGTMDSRYQPMIAPWDEGKILLLTNVGNWVSLPKAAITGVRVDVEAAGYGRVIDGTTVDLGLTANDRPATTGRPSTEEQLVELIRAQQADRPVYDTQQFVDPSETSGIPVGMIDRSGPPVRLFDSGAFAPRPQRAEPPQIEPSEP